MTEEEIRTKIQTRMESSFSGMIDRGIIPSGDGFNFQKIIHHRHDGGPWEPPTPFPSSTILTYSTQQKTIPLGDGSKAAEIIESAMREKDIEEYRKLCTVVEESGTLGGKMSICEDCVIRDGGGRNFFWIMCSDGAMILFHPWVMKRLHLKDEDWFGKLFFHDGEWKTQFMAAYQPLRLNYGKIIKPSVN